MNEEQAGDFMKMLSGMRTGMFDYEQRKIDKTKVNGFQVSTVWVDDVECFETAIIDAKGTHPVERYDDKGLAIAGHAKWIGFCEKANNQTQVCELGFKSLVANQQVILCQKEEGSL